LILFLLVISILMYRNWQSSPVTGKVEGEKTQAAKLVTFALVADVEGDNANLAKALTQAKSGGAEFVVGLGDLTQYGSLAELQVVKNVFERSGMRYYVLPGDHDYPASRDAGLEANAYFRQVFGEPYQEFSLNGTQFILIANADIYTGIDDAQWFWLSNILKANPPTVRIVLAHKTPWHPTSANKVMGAETPAVADQAKQLDALLSENKVNHLFVGDTHFFADFPNSTDSYKITTIGAVIEERSIMEPRFAIVNVYADGTIEVNDTVIAN